jgi:hypothetical protein
MDISSAATVWLRNSIKLPSITAGARTTLAGTTDHRAPPPAAHAAAITLLTNYMAASFVDAVHAQGGTSVIEAEAALASASDTSAPLSRNRVTKPDAPTRNARARGDIPGLSFPICK